MRVSHHNSKYGPATRSEPVVSGLGAERERGAFRPMSGGSFTTGGATPPYNAQPRWLRIAQWPAARESQLSTSGPSAIGRGVLRDRLKPSCRYNVEDRGLAHARIRRSRPPSRGPSARRRISSGRGPALRKPWDLVNNMKGNIVRAMLPFVCGHRASPSGLWRSLDERCGSH